MWPPRDVIAIVRFCCWPLNGTVAGAQRAAAKERVRRKQSEDCGFALSGPFGGKGFHAAAGNLVIPSFCGWCYKEVTVGDEQETH
jgi:hypothetical protein